MIADLAAERRASVPERALREWPARVFWPCSQTGPRGQSGVMALTVRKPSRALRFWPGTAAGWTALGAFGLALVLLLARLVLTPAIRLPLNFLVVFLVAAASGAAALYAVVIARERGGSVLVTLVVGLGAAAWLLAEALGGSLSNVTTLGEADNGSTVTVARGADIRIQLPGNPTTGYGWQSTTGDPSVLKPAGSTYKPSSGALGAGGTYTFRFTAGSPGTTVVTLAYQREWETGVAPLRTYTVTVVVR